MFTTLIRIFENREPSLEADISVKETPEPRSRRVERLIWISWILIALKSALTVWAIRRWNVPIHPLWVIGPTVLMAIAGTWIYSRRN